MLYVTTRSDRDAFTVCRAMSSDPAPDGGLFLPRKAPSFTEADLKAAAARSFNGNIVWVMNLLCRSEVSELDLDLVIGRGEAHLLDLDSRTVIAEIWKNGKASFEKTALRLFPVFVPDAQGQPGEWFILCLRIAVLFAVIAELAARGESLPVDVALPSFDFQAPMAAWYARSLGLPIGSIICACNENNAPWSLLHLGELRFDPVIETITPACDQAVPAGLERLILAALGSGEVDKFLADKAAGRLYTLEFPQRETLRAGVAVSVISHRRIAFMIPNLYRDGRWQPDLYGAMAYAALCDHRARAGETGKALIIGWDSPIHNADTLAGILNMPASHFRRKFET